MNLSLNLQFRDLASATLDHALSALQPARLAPRVGAPLCELTRTRLAQNNGHQSGSGSGNFWSAAAAATDWQLANDGTVTISVNQVGVRQRYRGGRISAKNVSALTVPINPAASGKSARDFANLILIRTTHGAYLAQPNPGSTGRQRSLTFLFKLMPSVDQSADPDVLPSADEYVEAGLSALNDAISEILPCSA